MSKFRLDFHLVLVVLLILILPLSLNSSQTHDIVTNISDLPIKDNVISYATSSAINFTSNVDFALQGFSGSGSVEDPYRIENLSIIVDGDCILVRDTTVHFVISNCYLSSVTHDYDSIFDDSAGAGVFLYNVSNCRIVDCIVQYKYYGCEIHRLSSNLLIEDNQISYCFHGGLFSGGASHGEVSENLFTHNFYGIELLGGGGTELTRFFNVSYNTLRYNSYGINCNAADSCIIDHNVVEKGGSGLEGYLSDELFAQVGVLSMMIENNREYTNREAVQLQFTVSNSASNVLVSEDSTFSETSFRRLILFKGSFSASISRKG